MQRINLLYVITKPELGGAQKQLLSLIRGLNQARFQPFLFTAREGLLLADFLSLEGLKIKPSRWIERRINPFKDIAALVEIYRFIKKNKIEIVHTHSSKAGILGRWAAKLAGVKVILHTVHGWSFHDYQPRFLRWIFTWLERLSADFSDKIIVVSDYDRSKGLASGIASPDKYALIRYGVDAAQFSTKHSRVREELGLSAGDPAVGMVACFKRQKAPQDFIRLAEAANRFFPGVKFILVGDGALRPKIERLVRKLDLEKQVLLTGWRRDIGAILSAIDVFVLTSLWEGLPIAVLEAVAAGCPVIASDTGGIREVIREGDSGFLVRPHDIQSLSQKLSLLLKDKQLRQQMADKARGSLGLDFIPARMVRESEDLYNNLIAAKDNGGGVCG